MSRDAAIEAGARAAFIREAGESNADLATRTWDNYPAEHHVKRYWRRVVAAALDAAAPHLSGDEYHTLDELYLYRMLYHAHVANEWARHGTYPVVKSRRHSDGAPCFGGGWFVVVATLPTGQVSNHYQDEHWSLFQVPEVPLPPEYDGHTPQVAAERLSGALGMPVTGAPHLVGEPVGYLAVTAPTVDADTVPSYRTAEEAAKHGLAVIALVPVEDQL